MRTLAILLTALFALVAPRGTRADDSEPEAAGEDEAQLQELERILAETAKPSSPDDPSCKNAPLTFRRKGIEQAVVVALLDCKGEPSSQALSELSTLAQPPTPGGEPVSQLNPGLLVRLQRIAEHFPDHEIDVVSGIRPGARSGSRHRSGDALDIHVDGVEDFAVAELARGFAGTGVGFYPNSTFVHIDVRDEAFSWVDRSRPGEKPEYAVWPEAKPAAAADSGPDAVSGSDSASGADSVSDSGSESDPDPESVSDSESVSAPVAAPAPSPADPELAALAERALLVMSDALDTNAAPASVPASPPEPGML